MEAGQLRRAMFLGYSQSASANPDRLGASPSWAYLLGRGDDGAQPIPQQDGAVPSRRLAAPLDRWALDGYPRLFQASGPRALCEQAVWWPHRGSGNVANSDI
jgi:hypothetical protein